MSNCFVTPWTTALQASLTMVLPRQEYSGRLPFPFPKDLPDPGIEPRSPTVQADALPSEPPGKQPISKECILYDSSYWDGQNVRKIQKDLNELFGLPNIWYSDKRKLCSLWQEYSYWERWGGRVNQAEHREVLGQCKTLYDRYWGICQNIYDTSCKKWKKAWIINRIYILDGCSY